MSDDLQAVTAFLYREARLMDRHLYDEWFALWTDPADYWIPADNADNRSGQISIVNEDRNGIADRIARLKSGAHYAQDPRSKLSRLVGNINIIDSSPETVHVECTVHIVACRKGKTEVLAGEATYTLNRHGNSFLIAAKRVDLITAMDVMKNLTFLI